MEVDMPSYGVGLWLDGENFCIRFPDQQHIKIPFQDPGAEPYSGVHRLVSVLRRREDMARAKQRPTIGTLGAPVQYDIDRVQEHLTREDEEKKKTISRSKSKKRNSAVALIREIAQRAREREGDELLALAGLGPPKPQPQLRKRA